MAGARELLSLWGSGGAGGIGGAGGKRCFGCCRVDRRSPQRYRDAGGKVVQAVTVGTAVTSSALVVRVGRAAQVVQVVRAAMVFGLDGGLGRCFGWQWWQRRRSAAGIASGAGGDAV